MTYNFGRPEVALDILGRINDEAARAPTPDEVARQMSQTLVDHVAYLEATGGSHLRAVQQTRLGKKLFGEQYDKVTAYNIIRATKAVAIGNESIAVCDNPYSFDQVLGIVEDGWGEDHLLFKRQLVRSNEKQHLLWPAEGRYPFERHKYFPGMLLDTDGRRAASRLLNLMHKQLAENPDGLQFAHLPRGFSHEVGFTGVVPIQKVLAQPEWKLD